MASWAITMIIRLRAATRRLDEERDGLLSSWKEGLLATTRAKHEDRGPERRTDARVTWTWSNDTGVRKAGGAAARAGMDRRPRAEAGGMAGRGVAGRGVAGRGRAVHPRWEGGRALGSVQVAHRPFHSRPRTLPLHGPASVLLPRDEVIGLTPGSILFSPDVGNKAANNDPTYQSSWDATKAVLRGIHDFK